MPASPAPASTIYYMLHMFYNDNVLLSIIS